MVPLAPIAGAFGAKLEYDEFAHTVRILLPVYYEFAAALGHPRTPCALRAVPSGWAPPAEEEYSHLLRTHLEEIGREGPPWRCLGDFNGDGYVDMGMALRKGTQIGLGALLSIEDEDCRFEWIAHPRDDDFTLAHMRTSYLSTSALGVAADPGAPARPTMSETPVLEHESVAYSDIDGGEVIYDREDRTGLWKVFDALD